MEEQYRLTTTAEAVRMLDLKRQQNEARKEQTTTPSPVGLATDRSFVCDVCWDSGYIGWKTPYSYPIHEVEFCDCDLGKRAYVFWQKKDGEQRNRKLEQLFEIAGVPERFRDLTIESLQKIAKADPLKESALAAAKALIAQGYVEVNGRRKGSLIISGPYGAGKTGTATPILRYWLDQGKSGLWIEFYDFCDRVQAGYSRGDSEAVMEAAKTADWILLDDVGELNRDDRNTRFAETTDRQKILYQLVNYRHNHNLPMLITTNLSPQEIAEQFGARTFERLMESCHIVHMAGHNLRTGG